MVDLYCQFELNVEVSVTLLRKAELSCFVVVFVKVCNEE